MDSTLITDNLFRHVLLDPARDMASDLYIVSGYASSAMVFHHVELLEANNLDINIHLIVGMTCRDGLSKANHRGFKELMEQDLSGKFDCSYLINQPPVHSKVYTWVNNGAPVKAFIGSANYSQQAFLGKSQREIASECDPGTAYEYYHSLIDDTIYCNHSDTENIVLLYKDKRIVSSVKTSAKVKIDSPVKELFDGLENAIVSLLSPKTNDVPLRSQLNWGQRPGRDPNQAYLQLSPNVYKSDFFPLRSIHFTVLTDDGKTLICTRAQKDEQGQAIETPQSNSLLGEYFRFRLNVPNGALVTKDHLIKYGRTDIDFYKIDEENYYLDFSV